MLLLLFNSSIIFQFQRVLRNQNIQDKHTSGERTTCEDSFKSHSKSLQDMCILCLTQHTSYPIYNNLRLCWDQSLTKRKLIVDIYVTEY